VTAIARSPSMSLRCFMGTTVIAGVPERTGYSVRPR
jgi:hypothetical protein